MRGRISRRAQLDAIQTINSGFEVVCAASDEAATASACNWRCQLYRSNKLSTQFTNIGVQKSVSARRLLGLDRFTWMVGGLGMLGRVRPGWCTGQVSV